MDGSTPPKKKSRFFSGSKTKLESIFHPSRKRKSTSLSFGGENNQSHCPLASTEQPAEQSRELSGERLRSQSAEERNARNDSIGSTQLTINPTFISISSNTSENVTATGKLGVNTDSKPSGSPTGQVSKAVCDLENLSVRDRRRDGIYGAESLLKKESNLNGTTNNNAEADHNEAPNVTPNTNSTLQPAVRSSTPALPLNFPAPPQSRFTFQSPQQATSSSRFDQGQVTSIDDFSGQGLVSSPAGVKEQSLLTLQPPPSQQQKHQKPVQERSTSQRLARSSSCQLTRTIPSEPHEITAAASALLDRYKTSEPKVDLDRDASGRLLDPSQLQRLIHEFPPGVRPLDKRVNTDYQYMIQRGPKVAPNIYNVAHRIPNAMWAARRALKRKRSNPVLPPPAYIYVRTNNPDFNVFQGILLYPELCFALAAHLTVSNLINLYAISKDFHIIIDTRFTTVILAQASSKAAESARTFGFRSYSSLCRNDPAARIPHPDPSKAAKKVVRRIPSFRWLKMIMHREKVVHEIMAVFAEDGIPLPARCALALKRMWFLMDIPDNARRIGYIHVRSVFDDLDLYFAMCFFVKLDMRLNDPIAIEKRDSLRRMLLSQRSLTTVLQFLKREIWRDSYEIMQAWLRCRYEHFVQGETQLTVLGVKPSELGRVKYEYWGRQNSHRDGKPVAHLLRPDQLIMREAIRRGLRFHKHFLRCFLYGYIRPDNLENYAPRPYGRRIDGLEDEEYDVDDIVGGVSALRVEDGGDPYLDLGQPLEVSPYTIVNKGVSKGEKAQREKEENFLNLCVDFAKREKEINEAEATEGPGFDPVHVDVEDMELDDIF